MSRVNLAHPFFCNGMVLSLAHATNTGASGSNEDASVGRASTHESMPELTSVPYITYVDTEPSGDTTDSEWGTQLLAFPPPTAEPLVSDDDTDVWSCVADDWTPRARSNSSDASGYFEPEYDFVPDEAHENGESESGCETDVPLELSDNDDFYCAQTVVVRNGATAMFML